MSEPKPWLRLWRMEEGTFAQLPLLARAIHAQMLKLADDRGVIQLGGRPPHGAVAFAMGADKSDRRALRKYIPMLIEEGCLVLDGDTLAFSGWAKRQPDCGGHDPQTPADGRERVANGSRTGRERVANGSRTGRERAPKPAELLPPLTEKRREEKRREEPPPPPQGVTPERTPVLDKPKTEFEGYVDVAYLALAKSQERAHLKRYKTTPRDNRQDRADVAHWVAKRACVTNATSDDGIRRICDELMAGLYSRDDGYALRREHALSMLAEDPARYLRRRKVAKARKASTDREVDERIAQAEREAVDVSEVADLIAGVTNHLRGPDGGGTQVDS